MAALDQRNNRRWRDRQHVNVGKAVGNHDISPIILCVHDVKVQHLPRGKICILCRPFWAYFVCLFVCLGISSHSRIFHSYGDVTIAGEGLQIFTYIRHSQYYCDTGQSLFNYHPRVPVTHTCCPAYGSRAATACFYVLGFRGWDSNTQPSACKASSLSHFTNAAVLGIFRY